MMIQPEVLESEEGVVRGAIHRLAEHAEGPRALRLPLPTVLTLHKLLHLNLLVAALLNLFLLFLLIKILQKKLIMKILLYL